MRAFIAICAIVGHATCIATNNDSAPPEISTEVTWVSAGAPEVHVLIRNSLSQPVEFAFTPQALKTPGSSTPCLSDGGKAIRQNFLRMATSEREIGASNGLVPAKGWAHRVYLLASGVHALGCVQPIFVRFFDRPGSKVTKNVEIRMASHEQPAFEGEVQGVNMVARSMVERDESYSLIGDFLIRTLVENTDTVPIVTSVSDRKVVCAVKNGDSVSTPVFTGDQVPQRLDSGPYTIAPGAWTVFVSNLTLKKSAKPGDCRVKIELSVLTKDGGFRPAMNLVVPLTPTGFFSGRGTRPISIRPQN